MTETINIALVTENLIMAEAAGAWLAGQPGFRVAALAAGPGGLAEGALPAGGVVIADLGEDERPRAVGGVRELAGRGYRVLAIGSRRTPVLLADAFAAGARGCLARERGLAGLAAAIRRVAADALIPPPLADTDLLAGGDSAARPDGPASVLAVPGARARGVPALSGRERAVLLAYVSGMTLESAARHVGVRPDTARTYLRRVKAKYAAAGRPAYTKIDLARRVWEEGGDGQETRYPAP